MRVFKHGAHGHFNFGDLIFKHEAHGNFNFGELINDQAQHPTVSAIYRLIRLKMLARINIGTFWTLRAEQSKDLQ